MGHALVAAWVRRGCRALCKGVLLGALNAGHRGPQRAAAAATGSTQYPGAACRAALQAMAGAWSLPPQSTSRPALVLDTAACHLPPSTQGWVEHTVHTHSTHCPRGPLQVAVLADRATEDMLAEVESEPEADEAAGKDAAATPQPRSNRKVGGGLALCGPDGCGACVHMCYLVTLWAGPAQLWAGLHCTSSSSIKRAGALSCGAQLLALF